MLTILLVDGNPLQALVRKSILETKFHNVRRVTDAVEALCLVEQAAFAENLGLVISSHHSPGMSGPAFVAELHSRMPGLPILVLGDATENPNDYKGQWVHFLSKPIANESMLAATDQMLKQEVR